MARRVCDVVCAFLALMNVLRVGVAADVNPEYTSISGHVPLFNVHLGAAVEAEEYVERVRREVNDNDKMSANMSEVETTPSLSSSSYRETVAVPRQPPTRTAPTTPASSATTKASTTTTKKTDSTTPPATTAPPSPSGSATTVQTTIKKETNHTYYKSRLVTGREARKYFVSYKEMKKHGRITHKQLSTNYRRAFAMSISFTFPFYGHELKKVTVATGGFLYMSSFLHRWLTTTQYIAPLMANFDTSLRNESFVHYADNGTSLMVLWENLLLKDNEEAGPFTFEVILHNDGTIIFSYYQMPMKISSILAYNHPVKVGLSDAFYIDTNFFHGHPTQRTIYRYHRVMIDTTEITNHTAVIITPLPTCNVYKTCTECLTASINFKCIWCPAVGRCSSGLDRKRQEWLDHSCHLVDIKVDQCPNGKSTMPPVTSPSTQPDHHNPTTSHTTLTPLFPSLSPTHPPHASTSKFRHTSTSTSPHTNTPRQLHDGTSESTHTNTPKSQHTNTPRSSHTGTPHANTPSSPHTNSSSPSTPHLKSPPSAVAVVPSRQSTRARAGVVLAVILLLCGVCGLVSWLVYAYKNPHSNSGLWLIKHRPSQLRKQLARVRFRKDRQSALGEKYSVSIDTPDSTFA